MIPFSVGDLVVSIVNHPEGNLDENAFIGLKGENLSVL